MDKSFGVGLLIGIKHIYEVLRLKKVRKMTSSLVFRAQFSPKWSKTAVLTKTNGPLIPNE